MMSSWSLMPVEHFSQRWERAYYAAIHGYYGAALTDLSRIRRDCNQQHWQSRANSLYGSLLRQLGHHRQARRYDGRALVLSGFSCGDYDILAAHDALVGLSADAIGLGQLRLAQMTLQRASQIIIETLPLQSQIYWHWVSAELAMVGNQAKIALEHSQKAQQLAQNLNCPHHQCKTEMIYAAALCAAGYYQSSRQLAQQTLACTDQYGLIPLSWGLCCLLGDLSHSDTERQYFHQRCCSYQNIIAHRGGQW